ncbi:MAG: CocE/NonD family hydrolase [Candidatus Hydrogenedentota bacterium]
MRQALVRRLCVLLVLVCVAPVACAENEPQHYRLPMEDGAKLATDVHLPEGKGPWPVVLMRSTYGREIGNPQREFLERGTATVIQDVRGMGDSGGEPYVFRAEGWHPGLMDGKATVDWIAAQPWCGGDIATHGGSALAITQVLLAPATDKLDAQYMEVGPASLYHDVVYHGGVFRKKLLEGWLKAIEQPHIVPIYKEHPSYDGFWALYDSKAKAGDITAPGVFVGAWYDIFCQGTIDAFTSREERGSKDARGNNYLVMKWGGHGKYDGKDYLYKENTQDLHVSDLRHDFFAAHLGGDTAALDKWPKVHYYTLGDDTAPGAPGNEWRTAEAWPPVETAATSFYLTSEGGLIRGAAPAANGERAFTFDPADPYPTHGGPNLLIPFGPYDQREYSETRDDLLVFMTPPLEEPLEATGRVKARLYVSTDVPDTDFTAKLVDVYPESDGRAINLLDGIIRVKYRNSLAEPAPLLEGPDQVVEVTVDLWTTSVVFNKGHRIALHVSSSNYPRFEVNPNNGDDFPEGAKPMRKARNAVHTGPDHRSALVLPVAK